MRRVNSFVPFSPHPEFQNKHFLRTSSCCSGSNTSRLTGDRTLTENGYMFAPIGAYIATSMKKRFARYLRPRRLQWRLTQREIAFLLGYQSASTISRIESG